MNRVSTSGKGSIIPRLVPTSKMIFFTSDFDIPSLVFAIVSSMFNSSKLISPSSKKDLMYSFKLFWFNCSTIF